MFYTLKIILRMIMKLIINYLKMQLYIMEVCAKRKKKIIPKKFNLMKINQ